VSGSFELSSALDSRFSARKASHVALEKRVGDRVFRTVVPQHSTVAKGTLSDILKQTGLTVEQLADLL
jgi:hypothetical protein